MSKPDPLAVTEDEFLARIDRLAERSEALVPRLQRIEERLTELKEKGDHDA